MPHDAIAIPAERSAAPSVARRIRGSLHDPYSAIGFAIYAVFAIVGIIAPFIAPYDPTAILMTPEGGLAANLPPSAAHLLGTTNMGRDIFSQLVMGTEPSLMVGISAAIGVAALGTLIGLLAGYCGGVVDAILMRLADVVLGIPFLPFVIILLMLAHGGNVALVACVVLLLWPYAARVIRSQVLTLKERPFVEAARVGAAPEWRILLIHVAPNVLPLSFLYATFGVGWAILTQAAVAFLGFGDTQTISWGFMLQDAYSSEALIRGQYNWFVPPGLCIVLVVLAGFLISRGYEDVLFPKLRN